MKERTSLYKALLAAMKEWQESNGTDMAGSMRDALTDMRHMADDEKLDFARLDCGAAEVYDDEVNEK